MSDAITTNVAGATVTIDRPATGETPSERLKAAAAREVHLEDELGRQIVLKKPSVLAQFDLIEALGDTAKNEVYMGMVLPLIFVASIDGVAVSTPSTKAEVTALIKRLDEPGLQAVMTSVAENFAPATTQEEAKND